jgi:hypothetical protein
MYLKSVILRSLVERRASYWTHKGRFTFLNRRIVLSENRIRFRADAVAVLD